MYTRQRGRPTFLPMYGYDTNATKNPTRLSIPMPGSQPSSCDYNFKMPRTPPPRSPILDQVLTDYRPSKNVVWFCEKKRNKSRSALYRKFAIGLVVLLTLALVFYKGGYGGAGRVRAGYQFQFEDETVQEIPEEESTTATLEESEMKADNTEPVTLEGNFTNEIDRVAARPARINIIYSVNEDLETTLEITEGR